MSANSQQSERKERTLTGSSNASMRTNLNEQLSKLHIKHQAEMDFLEDMRSFSKQRSTIEKEYSQNLLRLVQQFMARRDIKDPPGITAMDRSENRGLLEVWKMLLQKTEEIAKARQTVSEMLLSQVSEDMRQQRRIKEQSFKRLIDNAQKMNSEILESVKELVTSKKTYGDQEKVCSDARQKFSEAETRLRKGDRKLFESSQSLEKTYNKCTDRLKQCQKKTTVARNEYLLAVATTNAHLRRHATEDLPNLMKAMDGEMYDRARNVYMMYAQIDADAANLVKAEFEDLREQAYLVNRDYVVECFFHKYPVLKDLVEYQFEPHDKDTVTVISKDHGAEIFLEKDARKWAMRLVKHQASIATATKQIKGLKSVTTAYTKNPEFGTSEAFSEAQQKISESEETIREVAVKVTRTEARLEALREVGVDVSRWLEKAQEKTERTDRSSHTDLTALDKPASSLLTVTQDLGASEEWLETSSMSSRSGIDDAMSIGSGRSDAGPKYCIALYDYTAQRSDELNIRTDEELEILEWDDGDGWSKGRNQSGQEGYFPQTYVRAVSPSSSPRSSYQQVQQAMNSHFGSMDPLQELASQPLSGPTTNGSIVTNGTDLPDQSRSSSNVTMLRAMYEYSAQDDEELTFPEGAVIELLGTDDGVDDGFWKGRYEGKVGMFPSVVVEVISNGLDHSSSFGEPSTPVLDTTLQPPLYSPTSNPSSPSTGPTPVRIADHVNSTPFYSNNSRYQYSNTPKVRVQVPDTPEEELEQTWRMDSFEDYDGEESTV